MPEAIDLTEPMSRAGAAPPSDSSDFAPEDFIEVENIFNGWSAESIHYNDHINWKPILEELLAKIKAQLKSILFINSKQKKLHLAHIDTQIEKLSPGHIAPAVCNRILANLFKVCLENENAISLIHSNFLNAVLRIINTNECLRNLIQLATDGNKFITKHSLNIFIEIDSYYTSLIQLEVSGVKQALLNSVEHAHDKTTTLNDGRHYFADESHSYLICIEVDNADAIKIQLQKFKKELIENKLALPNDTLLRALLSFQKGACIEGVCADFTNLPIIGYKGTYIKNNEKILFKTNKTKPNCVQIVYSVQVAGYTPEFGAEYNYSSPAKLIISYDFSGICASTLTLNNVNCELQSTTRHKGTKGTPLADEICAIWKTSVALLRQHAGPHQVRPGRKLGDFLL
jgi:hypothetical protein